MPQHKNPSPIPIIVGPTASGKSALAVALARRLGGEVISADSRQLYRFMDVGTAKPTREEREGVPHHGFDLVAPDEEYSAGRFAREARGWIKGIQERGHQPIVAGGSGLYLEALVDGFFAGEDGKDPDLRKELERREGTEGLARLYEELEQRDPAYAAKTLPGDRQRILRALEVAITTGKPFSSLHDRQRDGLDQPVRWYGLDWPREVLYERIDRRVDEMLDRGLVAEVRGLLDRGYSGTNAMKSVGYAEIVDWLEGRVETLAEAAETIRRNTRHYAKRQLTWFRRNDRITWLKPAGRGAEALAELILHDLQAGSCFRPGAFA